VEAQQLAGSLVHETVTEHHPVFDACGSLLLIRFIIGQRGWENITLEQIQTLRPKEYYRLRKKPAQLR
jgi:hypothetical protein